MNHTKINKFTLFCVALRAHFIMSIWNFQRMLNLGFLFSIKPVLRKLYKTPELQKEAIQRHLKFFNTQPYFASFVLGLIAKKEEKLASLTNSPEEYKKMEQSVDTFKTIFMGPLGALGDALFWETLRPFLGLTAVLIIILCLPWSWYSLLGPVVFFVIYNLIHEYIRIGGVFMGFQNEEKAIQTLVKLNLTRVIDWIKNVAIFFAGILLGVTAFVLPAQLTTRDAQFYFHGVLRFAILVVLTGLFVYGLHKKLTTTRLFFISIWILWFLSYFSKQ